MIIIKSNKSKDDLPTVFEYYSNQNDEKTPIYFNSYRIVKKDILLKWKNKEVKRIKNCSDKQIKEFIKIFNNRKVRNER